MDVLSFETYASTPSQTSLHVSTPLPISPLLPLSAYLNPHLTNMHTLLWFDEEPPPQTYIVNTADLNYSPPLYYLYTITGLILIGPWPITPQGHPQPVNEHYAGWAYLTEDHLPLPQPMQRH